jgi:transcription elongation factor
MLSENESAVIIAVGAEKLRVMNHAGIVKEVFPMEIQSQRNSQSLRSTAIDSGDNSMKVGDVVNVISGEYAKKSGTIKHIMKGSLWLHSNSHLKNSGIFVTRGRAVVVAGSKTNTGASSMSMSITIAGRRGATAVTSAINSGIGTKIVPGAKPNHKVGKDSSIGTTVRITKGQYKGHMAQIVDATGDHYSVELLTQMKKISIEKAKTVPVGDKGGSRTRSNDEAIMANVVPSTPFLTAETPRHALDTPLYAGNETPGYGNQTPGRTPNSYYDDLWNENDADDRNNGNNDVLQPNSLNAHNNIESGSQIHDYSVNDGGSRTANDPSHNPLSRDSRYHNNINPLSSNSWTLGSSDDNSRRSQAGTPSISTNDAISPQSSMYSPANAKESPFVNNSIANKNKSYDQQVEEKKGVPPNEWVENMIMCIRKKAMAGKIAVIKDVSPMVSQSSIDCVIDSTLITSPFWFIPNGTFSTESYAFNAM